MHISNNVEYIELSSNWRNIFKWVVFKDWGFAYRNVSQK